MVTNVDDILGHETNFKKFLKIEIIQSILHHNVMKLKMNKRQQENL